MMGATWPSLFNAYTRSEEITSVSTVLAHDNIKAIARTSNRNLKDDSSS